MKRNNKQKNYMKDFNPYKILFKLIQEIKNKFKRKISIPTRSYLNEKQKNHNHYGGGFQSLQDLI